MRVRLKGSRGTTLELIPVTWAEAIEAATQNGWKRNGSLLGEQIIHAADSNMMATALKKASRNGYGELFVYLADFLTDNTISID